MRALRASRRVRMVSRRYHTQKSRMATKARAPPAMRAISDRFSNPSAATPVTSAGGGAGSGGGRKGGGLGGSRTKARLAPVMLAALNCSMAAMTCVDRWRTKSVAARWEMTWLAKK